MAPESILLSIRERSGEGTYRFSCPTCLHTIEKPADRKVAALLLSAGVELSDGLDDGLSHAVMGYGEDGEDAAGAAEEWEARPGGPPLTADDLIAFHFLLRDDAELLRALPSE